MSYAMTDEDFQTYSDLYKDAYGVRPRGAMIGTFATQEAFRAELQSLSDYAAANDAYWAEYVAEKEAEWAREEAERVAQAEAMRIALDEAFEDATLAGLEAAAGQRALVKLY